MFKIGRKKAEVSCGKGEGTKRAKPDVSLTMDEMNFNLEWGD